MESYFGLKDVGVYNLGSILGYLEVYEVFKVLSTCKQFYAYKDLNEIWLKVLDFPSETPVEESKCLVTSGIKVDTSGKYHGNIFLRIPDIYSTLVQEKNLSAITIARKIRKFIISSQRERIGVTPLESSSKEKNHSIMNTTNLVMDSYWSSQWLNRDDKPEWLLYKTHKPLTVISSIRITPVRSMGILGTAFAPSKVRFRVGFRKDHYHYTSRLFQAEKVEKDQYFSLMPDIVLGCYIKVEFYGKTKCVGSLDLDGIMSRKSKKSKPACIAIRKFSVQGSCLNTIGTAAEILPTLLNIYQSCVNLEQTLTPEEIKETEDILISMTQQNNIDLDFYEERGEEFFSWAFKRRAIFLKSDRIMNYFEPSGKISVDTNFYSREDVFDKKSGKLNLVKLILHVLYEHQYECGLMDKQSTEILLKMFFKCLEGYSTNMGRLLISNQTNTSIFPVHNLGHSFQNKIGLVDYILKFISSQNFKFYLDQYLFDMHFKYDQDQPGVSVPKIKKGPDEEESKEGSEFNPNYVKHVLLEQMNLPIEALKFNLQLGPQKEDDIGKSLPTSKLKKASNLSVKNLFFLLQSAVKKYFNFNSKQLLSSRT
ncbi:unnamed protein product [Moneuplotes crassus]|uniref:F-box domain-containing protein n=1 Tax=Euplotes crassus TaxID=5936 RepID=A0AAD1Y435_EUPCR|nr:unnamed protein product [Moneuplotes crassus]